MAMLTAEDIKVQQELLQTHRQTLSISLKQLAAQSNTYALPATISNIEQARHNIKRIKSILRENNIEVLDHPDDEEPIFATRSHVSHEQRFNTEYLIHLLQFLYNQITRSGVRLFFLISILILFGLTYY